MKCLYLMVCVGKEVFVTDGVFGDEVFVPDGVCW